ncbi:response regulator [Telluribacter humicola]|uniref:response regulator n=1 Tax=Telluribacter humicola TaxID=1720261 RepID=UPI001A957879|nr:response regulator [Telluribacter humicola]
MNYPLQCLLIDDDEDEWEIFRLALTLVNESIDCIYEGNGDNTLERLRINPTFTPDFIFIDMNMPGSNGLLCLLKIKNIERLVAVPTYIYSTSADPVAVEECRRLGAVDFFVKPPSIDKLSDILSQVFSNPTNR